MIKLTQHALDAMSLRSLDIAWITDTIENPERTVLDPTRRDRTHSYKAIPAFGMRILHVVHRPIDADVLVITVYFDRSARL